ncbi:hypothetical protein SSX86_019969 [Deinandra increscens subsp. villosa]|uniref:Transferase, Chloramphenicol acetyltransferase-like domain protein n=1 Tax=Deinandra increscens subsp. villosa TaxID=3103831 RepID=A0AAP0CTT3_9ASTR
MMGKQLHTIISREIIKPSNPTPSNLNTYNLSEIDIIAGKAYLPLVFFYPNNLNCSLLTAQEKARVLKKSLSQTLTRYYPFAGRLSTHLAPYIDCNDEGVVFLEATIDSELDAFKLISEHDENHLDASFADDMVCYNSPHNVSLVGVQLNHFVCGGVALAVSMSHIIGDSCTLASFMTHWASVAADYGLVDHKSVLLPLNPFFIHSPRSNSILPDSSAVINQDLISNYVMRTFVFPNSKLSDLKNKVVAAGSINNPTRVEVLTSLLHKTALLAAATNNSGCFKPSYLFIMVDIRNKLVEKLPQNTAGNFASFMMVPTRDKSETSLSMLVGEIKKHKLQMEGVQSVKHAAENLISSMSKLGNEALYACTSSCGFPFNKVDFGWGKPVATAFALRSAGKNGFVLMDTPEDDGIQAQVILEKQDMEVFENDMEMLSFCQMNNV